MKYLSTYKLFEARDYRSNLSNTPPETLEDQISFSIKWYPGLYDEKYGRIKVLEHMFLSYGTEYEWVDGKLIDETHRTELQEYESNIARWENSKKELQRDLDREIEHWNALHDIEQRTGENAGTSLARTQEKIEEIQNQMDDFDTWKGRYPCEEEPMSFKRMENYSKNYSPIFKMPDNITEEYLNGAKELINYILSYEGKPNEYLPYQSKKDTPLYRDIHEVAKKIGMDV